MIRWPGTIKPGTEIREMVVNIDSFATICGMLNIPMPADIKQHGRDFSPLLRGESYEPRHEFFGQYDLHNAGLAFMRMIRTDRYKLVRHHLANGLNELYDLREDPGETKNLYGNKNVQQVQRELQTKLTAWQKSIDDPILTNPLNTPNVGGGDRASD
jgi:choline-sulfatase